MAELMPKIIWCLLSEWSCKRLKKARSGAYLLGDSCGLTLMTLMIATKLHADCSLLGTFHKLSLIEKDKYEESSIM